MFSVILPSYLKPYPNSAKNPEDKLKRSIESVLAQTFKEFELIVVSDGCEKTIEIAQEYELNLYKINHHGGFGGAARNVGIEKATQDWIIYIDHDDYWGAKHLELVNDGMCACDNRWYYWNDFALINKVWTERKVNIKVKGACGTSNVTHKRSIGVVWGSDYLHDWRVIQTLTKFKGKYVVNTPQYYCCHIPKKYDE